jgi:hypothetical protein
MSRTRIAIWAASGALTGILFSLYVIAQIGDAYDEGGVYFPNLPHIALCWPILLAMSHWNAPRSLFLGVLYALNACTYAFLFLIIGMIHQTLSRGTTTTAGGPQ